MVAGRRFRRSIRRSSQNAKMTLGLVDSRQCRRPVFICCDVASRQTESMLSSSETSAFFLGALAHLAFRRSRPPPVCRLRRQTLVHQPSVPQASVALSRAVRAVVTKVDRWPCCSFCSLLRVLRRSNPLIRRPILHRHRLKLHRARLHRRTLEQPAQSRHRQRSSSSRTTSKQQWLALVQRRKRCSSMRGRRGVTRA